MICSLIRMIREDGLSSTMKYAVLKWLGLEKSDEEIRTLFYFLDNYVDIRLLPATKDINLRNLQNCDAALLRVVHELCVKYGIAYWIDFGTLLGAFRHKGFIPWDDDLDISMRREDYNNFLDRAGDEIVGLGLEIRKCKSWVGIGYKHDGTGSWVDVFPYDSYYSDKGYSDANKEIVSKFSRGADLSGTSGINKYLYLVIDRTIDVIQDESDIFPTGSLEFEGHEFSVPKNPDASLRRMFGNNYMSFPHYGVEHHGNSTGSIKMWGPNNGIDMTEIRKELESMVGKIH